MTQHPINVVDSDYFVFVADGTDLLKGQHFSLRVDKPFDEGCVLLLNRRGLFIKNHFGPDDIDILEDEDKRYVLEDYLEKAYLVNDEVCELDELNVVELMPVDDSFKAEKDFYLAMPQLLLNRHKLFDFKPLTERDVYLMDLKQSGYRLCEIDMQGDERIDVLGWEEDIDEGIADLVDDFNKLEYIYVDHFCCSGLQEEHSVSLPKNYGFLRFKADVNSELYQYFEVSLSQLEDKVDIKMEILKFLDGLELRLYPGDNGDESLKQAWGELRNVLKDYLEHD